MTVKTAVAALGHRCNGFLLTWFLYFSRSAFDIVSRPFADPCQLDGRRGASFVSFNQEGQVVYVREAQVRQILL